MAKIGSKNNPDNRGTAAKAKHHNGKVLKPVKYYGAKLGHGNYMAAQYEDGQLVCDNAGKPLPWKQIG